MSVGLSRLAENVESRHYVKALRQPKVLIATVHPEMRDQLANVLAGLSVNPVWAKSVEYVKMLLRKEHMAACLCGLWLQDGTFRDLIRHIRRVRVEIPVIIASEPAGGAEYGQLLGAMNIGALGFLPHPYHKLELERMLKCAQGVQAGPVRPGLAPLPGGAF